MNKKYNTIDTSKWYVIRNGKVIYIKDLK